MRMVRDQEASPNLLFFSFFSFHLHGHVVQDYSRVCPWKGSHSWRLSRTGSSLSRFGHRNRLKILHCHSGFSSRFVFFFVNHRRISSIHWRKMALQSESKGWKLDSTTDKVSIGHSVVSFDPFFVHFFLPFLKRMSFSRSF